MNKEIEKKQEINSKIIITATVMACIIAVVLIIPLILGFNVKLSLILFSYLRIPLLMCALTILVVSLYDLISRG